MSCASQQQPSDRQLSSPIPQSPHTRFSPSIFTHPGSAVVKNRCHDVMMGTTGNQSDMTIHNETTKLESFTYVV